MATTKLRKAFKYPEEDDSEPEGIDEEEQEELIKTYIEQDAKKTEGYKKAFLALPVLLAVLYIPSLLTPTAPTSTSSLIILPGLTSLLSTAYSLYAHPTSSKSPQETTLQVRAEALTPLRKYLDHLNAILCIMLLPAAWKARRTGRDDDMWFAVMPAAVFVVIFLVRTQLRPLDVSELERLKYGYKGA